MYLYVVYMYTLLVPTVVLAGEGMIQNPYCWQLPFLAIQGAQFSWLCPLGSQRSIKNDELTTWDLLVLFVWTSQKPFLYLSRLTPNHFFSLSVSRFFHHVSSCFIPIFLFGGPFQKGKKTQPHRAEPSRQARPRGRPAASRRWAASWTLGRASRNVWRGKCTKSPVPFRWVG